MIFKILFLQGRGRDKKNDRKKMKCYVKINPLF